MTIEPGRLKFTITGTGAQRKLIRVPAGPNGFIRYAFLRAPTANTATASLYLYADNPVDTSGTVLGGTLDYGVVGTGVDPATVPGEYLVYSKTGVALTQSTTAPSINEAATADRVASGERVIMVDMTAATGAWEVTGYFTLKAV